VPYSDGRNKFIRRTSCTERTVVISKTASRIKDRNYLMAVTTLDYSANHSEWSDSQSTLRSYGFVTFQKLLFVNQRTIVYVNTHTQILRVLYESGPSRPQQIKNILKLHSLTTIIDSLLTKERNIDTERCQNSCDDSVEMVRFFLPISARDVLLKCAVKKTATYLPSLSSRYLVGFWGPAGIGIRCWW
jgi:hypothetical protein